MPKIAFKTIDDYIDAQPETSKPILHRLRSILRKALPEAEEVISYGIPPTNRMAESFCSSAGGPTSVDYVWVPHISRFRDVGRQDAG